MRFDTNSDAWDFKIEPEEIHVWSIVLDAGPGELQRLSHVLTPDEHERAEKFRFARDRQRFVVGRGLLRMLLAAYTQQRPGSLQFSYGPKGKPYLSRQAAPFFNVAHSEAQALYAICVDRPVGVDIEHIRPLDGYLDIARDHFAAAEYSRIASAPEEDKVALFFRYWTLKEALVKASGKGIDRFRDFRLRVLEKGAANVEFFDATPDFNTQWHLQWFHPTPEHAGALAVIGSVTRLVARACPDLDKLCSFLA